MYADENVIKIKHDVLYTVAKLAFEGRLEEERDHIATELRSEGTRLNSSHNVISRMPSSA